YVLLCLDLRGREFLQVSNESHHVRRHNLSQPVRRVQQTNNRLAARGESPSSHRGGRCARIARRETREYRECLSGEQRREAGCSVRRMQTDFYHGLLAAELRI